MQAKDASVLIGVLLRNPTVASLALASDCLGEGTEVTPELREAWRQRVETGLESDDPGTAQLAARVKLTQRLNGLKPLDEHRYLDDTLVTQAEYQVFIDDRRQAGDIRRPDHWLNDRFAPGTAREPIAGVRAEDAAAFCGWLTEQYPEAGIRYRLPTPEEGAQIPLASANFGFWCKRRLGTRLVGGVFPAQLEQARSQLKERFKRDLTRGFARLRTHILGLLRNSDVGSNLDLAIILNFHRVPAPNLFFNPPLELALARARSYSQIWCMA